MIAARVPLELVRGTAFGRCLPAAAALRWITSSFFIALIFHDRSAFGQMVAANLDKH